ncbi:hypothetical protein [Caballeronia sp. SBC2]|uniref:hypothetical protein n=1 Tax=Caballeronia sp. SBC2 TaxID=2705547 RepID=UPI0013ED25E8|nr:hypothetical protein [Caballeronia sp. SBC2]
MPAMNSGRYEFNAHLHFFARLASISVNKTPVLAMAGRAYRGSGSQTATLHAIRQAVIDSIKNRIM